MKNAIIIVLSCAVLVLTVALIFLSNITGTILNASFKSMYGVDISKAATSKSAANQSEEFEKLQKIVEGQRFDDQYYGAIKSLTLLREPKAVRLTIELALSGQGANQAQAIETLFELGSASLLDPNQNQDIMKSILTLADRNLAVIQTQFDQIFKTESSGKLNMEVYTIAGHLTDTLFSSPNDHAGGQEFLNHIASEHHVERAIALSISYALTTKQNTNEPGACPKDLARFKGVQNLNAELKRLGVKFLKPSACSS